MLNVGVRLVSDGDATSRTSNRAVVLLYLVPMMSRRVVAAAVLSLATACSDSLPTWPEAEPAAATCIYKTTPSGHGAYDATSTLYYDDRGRVFRVDGFEDDGPRLERAAYFFEYDDRDRLLQTIAANHDVQFSYSPQQIVETEQGYRYTYDLVDARVSLWQGPTDLPEAERNAYRFEYDSSGHITRRTTAVRFSDGTSDTVQISRADERYTYVTGGDLAKIVRDNGETRTFVYARTAQQLAIEMTLTRPVSSPEVSRLTIDYDAGGRITRVVRELASLGTATIEYSYPPEEIVETYAWGTGTWTTTATGSCPAIAVDTAPAALLPITWSATRVRQFEPHAHFDALLYAVFYGAPISNGGP